MCIQKDKLRKKKLAIIMIQKHYRGYWVRREMKKIDVEIKEKEAVRRLEITLAHSTRDLERYE